ncbi:unnamed protein product [Eretmochelys imbricata]
MLLGSLLPGVGAQDCELGLLFLALPQSRFVSVRLPGELPTLPMAWSARGGARADSPPCPAGLGISQVWSDFCPHLGMRLEKAPRCVEGGHLPCVGEARARSTMDPVSNPGSPRAQQSPEMAGGREGRSRLGRATRGWARAWGGSTTRYITGPIRVRTVRWVGSALCLGDNRREASGQMAADRGRVAMGCFPVFGVLTQLYHSHGGRGWDWSSPPLPRMPGWGVSAGFGSLDGLNSPIGAGRGQPRGHCRLGAPALGGAPGLANDLGVLEAATLPGLGGSLLRCLRWRGQVLPSQHSVHSCSRQGASGEAWDWHKHNPQPTLLHGEPGTGVGDSSYP